MDDNNQKPPPPWAAEPISSQTPPEPLAQPSQATEPTEDQVIPEDTPEYLSPDNVQQQADLGNVDMYLNDESSGKKKKIIMIATGIIISIVVIFAIFKIIVPFFRGKEKVTLVYWGLWEDEEVVQPLIDEYEKKNPQITIKYEKRPIKSYREQLIGRGNEGGGPDIFRYHNTWLPTIIQLASPIPETVMTKDEFEKTFYPVVISDLKYDNNYYGIPLEIDGLVLVYNDDLFKNVGLNEPPTTWDQVLEKYAPELTLTDGINITTAGIALGTSNNISHFSDIFGLILLQNGGEITNLTSQQAIESLQFYRTFAEAPNNYWDTGMPYDVDAFTSGKLAMIFVPSWEIANIKATNGNLNIKVAPVPSLPQGETISIANYWVEGVSKTSKHQKDAWDFLKFLVTKESLTKLYSEQTKTRLFGEPYSRVDMKSMLINDPYLAPVINQAPKMRSLPLISRTSDNGINDQIVSYLANAINQTINGVGYREALATANNGINGILNQYKYYQR